MASSAPAARNRSGALARSDESIATRTWTNSAMRLAFSAGVATDVPAAASADLEEFAAKVVAEDFSDVDNRATAGRVSSQRFSASDTVMRAQMIFFMMGRLGSHWSRRKWIGEGGGQRGIL